MKDTADIWVVCDMLEESDRQAEGIYQLETNNLPMDLEDIGGTRKALAELMTKLSALSAGQDEKLGIRAAHLLMGVTQAMRSTYANMQDVSDFRDLSGNGNDAYVRTDGTGDAPLEPDGPPSPDSQFYNVAAGSDADMGELLSTLATLAGDTPDGDPARAAEQLMRRVSRATPERDLDREEGVFGSPGGIFGSRGAEDDDDDDDSGW